MPVLRDDDKVDPMEAELEALQEQAELQRQYRCMRNDRKIYTEETENAIRRQKAAIASLLKENEELVTLNKVAGSQHNELFDLESVKSLQQLLDREKEVLEEIRKEKGRVSNLDLEVRERKEKVNEQRKKSKRRGRLRQADASKSITVINQKHIRVLQNRLDNASKKFNQALAKNRHLREYINHIEIHKARFQELEKRLRNELVEGKKEIERVSEMATAHFSSRDEAQHRMASLKERAERDLALYNQEIKNVMRIIDHDRMLRDFMKTKAEDRVSILEEELQVRELKKLVNQVAGLKTEASKYEEIFKKIKEATGVDDTATLVESFIEKEDNNFGLFNYVNAMNADIVALQEEIKFLSGETEQIKKEGVANDLRRKDIMKELEAKLAAVTEETGKIKKSYKANRRALELVKPRIETTFNAVKCDRAVINEMLGGGVTVDDNNVMLYLGIIEQKCNELLQIKTVQKLKALAGEDQIPTPSAGLLGPGPHPPHSDTKIVPPCIDEENETSGLPSCDSAKPLTVEEVRGLIARGGPGVGRGAGQAGPGQKPGTRKRKH